MSACSLLPVLLGSSSVFRARQLALLQVPFTQAAPDIDESARADESAAATAERLAEAKARALASQFPAHLIIGCDQVAWCDGARLGKPMTQAKAMAMLLGMSGKRVDFYTALVLLNADTGALYRHTDHTCVHMRTLTAAQIGRYLAREPDAVYCAGAAKSEGLGMSLIASIHTHDPQALIGLPMLALVGFLQQEGYELP